MKWSLFDPSNTSLLEDVKSKYRIDDSYLAEIRRQIECSTEIINLAASSNAASKLAEPSERLLAGNFQNKATRIGQIKRKIESLSNMVNDRMDSFSRELNVPVKALSLAIAKSDPRRKFEVFVYCYEGKLQHGKLKIIEMLPSHPKAVHDGDVFIISAVDKSPLVVKGEINHANYVLTKKTAASRKNNKWNAMEVGFVAKKVKLFQER